MQILFPKPPQLFPRDVMKYYFWSALESVLFVSPKNERANDCSLLFHSSILHRECTCVVALLTIRGSQRRTESSEEREVTSLMVAKSWGTSVERNINESRNMGTRNHRYQPGKVSPIVTDRSSDYSFAFPVRQSSFPFLIGQRWPIFCSRCIATIRLLDPFPTLAPGTSGDENFSPLRVARASDSSQFIQVIKIRAYSSVSYELDRYYSSRVREIDGHQLEKLQRLLHAIWRVRTNLRIKWTLRI